MRSAAREVQLDILHKNVRAGRNGNKHAMVPTRQDVVVVAAAAAAMAAATVAMAAATVAMAAADIAVAAADASAAAAVARGAVKPIAADTVRGAANPTADDDEEEADGLCRRVCRKRCHGLRGPVEPLAAPLAAASRLYTCGQGMGAAGTAVARPRVLDPSQGFPQLIGASACYRQKHLFSTSKSEGRLFRMRRLMFF